MPAPEPTIIVTKPQLDEAISVLWDRWNSSTGLYTNYLRRHLFAHCRENYCPGTQDAPEPITGVSSVTNENLQEAVNLLSEQMVLLATCLKNDPGIPRGALLQADKHLAAMESQMNIIRSLPLTDAPTLPRESPTETRQKIFGVDVTRQLGLSLRLDSPFANCELEEIDVRIKIQDGKLTVTA